MVMLLIGNLAAAQCNIKSADNNSAHITYYMDSELLTKSTDIGLALSVQMVGNNNYLALTYKFPYKPEQLEEKVALVLVNGYTIELEMYTMQGGSAGGVLMTMAVYNLYPELYDHLTGSDLKEVRVVTQDGRTIAIPVTVNANSLRRQLKCFGK